MVKPAVLPACTTTSSMGTSPVYAVPLLSQQLVLNSLQGTNPLPGAVPSSMHQACGGSALLVPWICSRSGLPPGLSIA